MVNKISVLVELGLRGIEKREVHVYLDGKLADSFFDVGNEDITAIAGTYKSRHPEAEIEITCTGEDCCGRTHTWKLEV